jgi:hypothetical protein
MTSTTLTSNCLAVLEGIVDVSRIKRLDPSCETGFLEFFFGLDSSVIRKALEVMEMSQWNLIIGRKQ